MPTITVRFSPERREDILREAKMKGWPASRLIRAAVEAYLEPQHDEVAELRERLARLEQMAQGASYG